MMDKKMTLEQVRDWHRDRGDRAAAYFGSGDHEDAMRHRAMADAIDAELKARGEPVAIVGPDDVVWLKPEACEVDVLLYTAPPAPKIDDAMVERALRAPFAHYSVSSFIPVKSPTSIRNLMRAALEAALEETI